jgi:hypothetical protein
MTLESKKYGPFNKVKDQRDGFMEPLTGRLPFNEIFAMPETEVDKRLEGHLRGKSAFTDSPPEVSEERKSEIKRIFLAVLEGFQAGGKTFADWFEEMEGRSGKARTSNPQNYIGKLISVHASDAYRERREYAQRRVLFETELISPRPEVAAQMGRIQTVLLAKGLAPLKGLDEILLPVSLTLDKPEIKPLKRRWDVNDLLRLFYLTVQGERTDEQIAQVFEMNRTAVSQARALHFTREAKRIMRRARGFDPYANAKIINKDK